MKKVIVLAMALMMTGIVATAQEPVKKVAKDAQKVEHKCKGDCKNHKHGDATAKDHNCGSKDANHKCTGDCKNHKKDASTVKAHNCGSKDANHKCKGDCKNHKVKADAKAAQKTVKK